MKTAIRAIAMLGISLALVVGMVTPATAADTGKISGTVRTANGAPIEGVTVNALFDGGFGHDSEVTNAQGKFTFQNLANFSYDISFAPYAGLTTVQNFRVAITNSTKTVVGVDAIMGPEGSIEGTIDIKGADADRVSVYLYWLDTRANKYVTLDYREDVSEYSQYSFTISGGIAYRVVLEAFAAGASTPYARVGSDRIYAEGEFPYLVANGYTSRKASHFRTFNDVPRSHKFFPEIDTMYYYELSRGTIADSGAREYRPDGTTTRGQMAAFLYRLKNAAFVGPAVPTFADVPKSHKFYDEIEWMYAEGYSQGTLSGGKRVFNPSATLNRGTFSAFLYRIYYDDETPPAPPTTASFTDVPTTNKFFAAIEWMKSMGITTGIRQSNGTYKFQPAADLNRGAMAAFLSRYLGIIIQPA